jgi:hypothetical protein
MKRVTLVKVLINNQDEALEFYTEKLGFGDLHQSGLTRPVGSGLPVDRRLAQKDKA